MLCDNTFLCPRTLFSSPISSWLGSPLPTEAAKQSLFQPPGVHKEPEWGQNHQSHLYCCLDNTSPRPAFTSTSTAASGCSMPRLAELVPVSPCSCRPRAPQFFHSQVNSLSRSCLQVHFRLSLRSHLTSQERACKCSGDFHSQVSFTSQERVCQSTLDFHSQVNSLSRLCLQVHCWLSLLVNSPLKTCSQVHHWLSLTSHPSALHPIREGLPLWHGSLFVAQSSCSCEPDTATWCQGFCV